MNKIEKNYLEGVFEVLEGHHLDPEELHAHQKGDNRLCRVCGSLPTTKLTQFRKKLLFGRQKSGISKKCL